MNAGREGSGETATMTEATGDAPGDFGRFFLPGPTEVRPAVLEAQARPMIGHRGAGIEDLMARLQVGLKELFRTRRPVIVSGSSATGLMEAAVRNGARSRVLSLVNGAFSERFARIAEACGFDVDVVEVPWGAHHDPADVGRRLREEAYDAVTVVHSETSTGVLNPVRDIAAAARESGDALVLVDSVTGVAGAPLLTDAWELDFVLTGSQKAMALPPGLAFGVASERMMARSREATRKGVYFDLVEFERYLEKNQTPNTPPLSLMYALEVQLQAMAREGIQARWDRHRSMADACAAWVERMAAERSVPLSVLAEPAYRSPTVTCIELPEGVAGPDVVSRMKALGYVIGGGYGKLRAGTVRIGHMGDHTLEELEALLDVLEEVLTA